MIIHDAWRRTCVSGVDPEALVPEATQEDEAVVCGDDKTLGADLNALIQQVWDLSSMSAHVTGYTKKKKRKKNLNGENAQMYSNMKLQYEPTKK